MRNKIKLVQQFLKQDGLYNDKIDGLVGKNTLNGLAAITGISTSWSTERKINAAIQFYAGKNGLDIGPIDGWWRPDTIDAFEQLQYLLAEGQMPPAWRPEDLPEVNPNNWPKQYTAEFDQFYGHPGENLVTLILPYQFRLSWKPYSKVTRLSCHSKVKDSLERVLVKVKNVYGEAEIRNLKLDVYGGCFNKRKVRGGTRWSMHSWGIALDFDPTRNQLKWGRDKATFAKPEYNQWWEIWEEEGWLSLGRQRNFDWMHVQAAKL